MWLENPWIYSNEFAAITPSLALGWSLYWTNFLSTGGRQPSFWRHLTIQKKAFQVSLKKSLHFFLWLIFPFPKAGLISTASGKSYLPSISVSTIGPGFGSAVSFVLLLTFPKPFISIWNFICGPKHRWKQKAVSLPMVSCLINIQKRCLLLNSKKGEGADCYLRVRILFLKC